MSPACCLPSPENDVPSLPFWPPSGVLPPPPIDWFGHKWLVQRLVHDPSWANGGPSLGFWTWKGRECQSVLLSGGGYETRGPGLISCQQQGGSSAGRRNKLTRGRDEEHVLLQFKCLFSVTLVHSCSSGYSMDCSLMVVGTVTNSHSSSPSSWPRYMTAVFAFCKKMR